MSLDDPHPWSGVRWFANIVYREIVQMHPRHNKNLLFQEIHFRCVREWAVMSARERERFLVYAEQDRALVERSLASNNKTTTSTCKKSEEEARTPLSSSAKKSKIAKKDPNRPHKPPTAYLQFYIAKHRQCKQANPDMTYSDIAKVLSKEWNAMSEMEKEPYVKEYKRKMSLYKGKMAKYKKEKKEREA
eukprot:TRINITY_DN12748_c0_g4_i1.p1 TRINITY_DN12748_c0_g4~~TRINITY_DN12748_c0_g4_i1.p1  ORF type:complete len:189 (+),score=64.67 TRINITY_DN12748_c0_g4_i1:194-760(+)